MKSSAPSDKTLRIVHLDDDPFELERVAQAFEKPIMGTSFGVESVGSVVEYKRRLESQPAPDIAILDIHLDDSTREGISLVRETKEAFPEITILMCSGMDDVSTIAESLNSGADDFLSKRSDERELGFRVYTSYMLARLKKGRTESNTVFPSKRKKPAFAGESLERISKRIPFIIQSAISSVHVEGESGTGKEMVADLFAYHLPENTPFVRVNCGAIAPTLLESELFGHVKGAFTGAQFDRKGLLETASGGWIFLDEVSSLSPSAQVALLRVLENQELIRVGATQPKPIQVKILSATNEPLPHLVKEGKFRKDLWQRLCEGEIKLVPLRERPEEIRVLVKHFCETMPGGPYLITEPAIDVLCSLDWKSGNVRELRNCLRAMTEFHINKLLTPLAIPERIWKGVERETNSHEPQKTAVNPANDPIRKHELTVRWDTLSPLSFDSLSNLLLVELIKKLNLKHGKLSLRRLSKEVGLARSTLSARLRTLSEKHLEDLRHLI
ncbi:MAG: sigma-54-dependent Fis family transcriptional regulator [Deltaproteobacteria bacterium]|nr:sigma-54-dependent Fis family transcriptional regulator [Deltaproteobacteria bacterium]